MSYVKVTGHKDPTNFTAEVIFERDEETGEPTAFARKGEPTELSADQVKYLEKDGFVVEKSTKQEYDAFHQRAESGPAPDVMGSGPVLDAASQPAPGASEADADDQGAKSGSRKNS